MYSVTVRGHMMIAHSLPDPFFGPAQNMHGATYIVDATFYSPKLNEANVVIDIGLAHEHLNATLGQLNYQNLDELPEFANQLTTTEFLSKWIHAQLKDKLREAFSGRIKVTLGESHVAWASYEG